MRTLQDEQLLKSVLYWLGQFALHRRDWVSMIFGSLIVLRGPPCLRGECLGLKGRGLGLAFFSLVESHLQSTSASFTLITWVGGGHQVFSFLNGLAVVVPVHRRRFCLSSVEVHLLNLRRGGQSGSSSSPFMSLRIASSATVSTVQASWFDSIDRSNTSR